MRRLYLVVPAFLVLSFALILVSDKNRSIAAEPDAQMVVKSVNAFAVDLYPKLKEGNDNLFFAPYSISTALAMTYGGARGATETQMAKTLHFENDRQRLPAVFGSLAAGLESSAAQTGCTLNLVNGLWGQKGFPFLKEYQELISQGYRGRLTELDFQKVPEQSRETINKAVEQQTEGKILELIPTGLIDEQTKLVLTNAIYFKGAWAEPFAKKGTQEGEFTLLDGSKIQVQMMRRTGSYGYSEADGLQALELPYKGYAFSLIVFLPKEPAGLAPLEKSLTSEKLAELLDRFREQEVAVSLPRFTIKTPSYRLSRILAALGMTDAFTSKADFSGIDGEKDLCLKDVLHKAFVDVNEEGTEAAAATAVVMRLKAGMPSSPPVFRADHPFLFVIRHNSTKCILFMGRLTKP
jgi:serpin B